MASQRVALYIRVSTADQNPELQLRELSEYILARGWQTLRVYEDRATGTNTNRKMFQELVADARQRKFDILLVWKLDRAFRSLRDTLSHLQEFADLGIQFVSLKDSGIDMTIPSGVLLLHLLSAFSQFEASIIKMRVRAGLANAKARGRKLGRPNRINHEQAIELRRQGFSLKQIGEKVGATKSGVSKLLSKRRLNKSALSGDSSTG